MAGLKLTMALSHYDRHIPFFDRSVQAEGVDLQILEVGQSEPLHGRDRHERMLQKREFDVCELSLSSYLMAKSRACRSPRFQSFPAGSSAYRRCGSMLIPGSTRRSILSVSASD